MTERFEVQPGFGGLGLAAVHEPEDLREIFREENGLGNGSGREVNQNDGGGNALPFFQFLVELDAAFEVPDEAGQLDVDDRGGRGLHEFLAGRNRRNAGRTRGGGAGESRLGTGRCGLACGRGI